ncbi:TcpE family conjugal transfer membrane protein, partial [Spirillospora sp. NPDC049652]
MDLPTYTNIWRIEKRLYKLYDLRLPMPLPLVQIGVFAGVFIPWILMLRLVGLPFKTPWHVIYLVPPWLLTWLATRPVIEGKRLTELLLSHTRFLAEPRTWCRLTPIREPREVVVVGRVWRRADHAAERAAVKAVRRTRKGRKGRPQVEETAPAAIPAVFPAALGTQRAPAHAPSLTDAAIRPALADPALQPAYAAEPAPQRAYADPDPQPQRAEPVYAELEPPAAPLAESASPADAPPLAEAPAQRPPEPDIHVAGATFTPDADIDHPPATPELESPAQPGSGKRALASGIRRPGAPADFWETITQNLPKRPHPEPAPEETPTPVATPPWAATAREQEGAAETAPAPGATTAPDHRTSPRSASLREQEGTPEPGTTPEPTTAPGASPRPDVTTAPDTATPRWAATVHDEEGAAESATATGLSSTPSAPLTSDAASARWAATGGEHQGATEPASTPARDATPAPDTRATSETAPAPGTVPTPGTVPASGSGRVPGDVSARGTAPTRGAASAPEAASTSAEGAVREDGVEAEGAVGGKATSGADGGSASEGRSVSGSEAEVGAGAEGADERVTAAGSAAATEASAGAASADTVSGQEPGIPPQGIDGPPSMFGRVRRRLGTPRPRDASAEEVQGAVPPATRPDIPVQQPAPTRPDIPQVTASPQSERTDQEAAAAHPSVTSGATDTPADVARPGAPGVEHGTQTPEDVPASRSEVPAEPGAGREAERREGMDTSARSGPVRFGASGPAAPSHAPEDAFVWRRASGSEPPAKQSGASEGPARTEAAQDAGARRGEQVGETPVGARPQGASRPEESAVRGRDGRTLQEAPVTRDDIPQKAAPTRPDIPQQPAARSVPEEGDKLVARGNIVRRSERAVPGAFGQAGAAQGDPGRPASPAAWPGEAKPSAASQREAGRPAAPQGEPGRPQQGEPSRPAAAQEERPAVQQREPGRPAASPGGTERPPAQRREAERPAASQGEPGRAPAGQRPAGEGEWRPVRREPKPWSEELSRPSPWPTAQRQDVPPPAPPPTVQPAASAQAPSPQQPAPPAPDVPPVEDAPPPRPVRSGPASPVRPRPLPPPPEPPRAPEPAITPPDPEHEVTGGGLRRLFHAVGGGHGDADAEYEQRLQQPFQGSRHIVVLGCTGGAGQTVTALMLGHTFAQHNGEPVVAVDVNPGPGALARRTRSETNETLTGLITRADQIGSLTAMRRYTSQARSGLDVIAAGKNPLQALDDRDYALAIRTIDRFYSVTLLDAAAAVVARVLPYADQVVLVAPASADAPRAVAMTYEWLDGHGYTDLRQRAVTVINGVSRRSMDDVEQAEAVARGRCRALVRIPWDDHLSMDRAPRNELKAL